jgi:hypothetical protein
MSRQDNFDDKLSAVLSAHKPRAWGEEIDSNSSGYSSFNSQADFTEDMSSKFSIGSSVVPWNCYSFRD